MARKKKHEEHVNAEAWAIPYGDLVTLLFALFTVMYAVSSVNEGKFRVLSDSMIAAFHGAPKSMQPINIGEKQAGKGGDKELVGVSPTTLMKLRNSNINLNGAVQVTNAVVGRGSDDDAGGVLSRMEREVQEAMKPLIESKMVSVKRDKMWLEIEINTDILFPSGASNFSTAAQPVLDKLAEVLKPFPNLIRVEGHTDDLPIRTAAFPSNWELSAARAASVVHQFMKAGVDPLRLEIVGFGEFQPKRPNDSAEGRNANRRVTVLVLDELKPPAGAVATADASGAANAAGAATALGGANAAGPNVAGATAGVSPPGAADRTVLSSTKGTAPPPPAHHE